MFCRLVANSPFCLLNITDTTDVALGDDCSLLDPSLPSTNVYAHTSLDVEDELFDSVHFPTSITFDVNPSV